MGRHSLRCAVLSYCLCGVAGLVLGCTSRPSRGLEAPQSESVEGDRPAGDLRDLSVVSDVKRRHDDVLMAIPGVVGTGVSKGPTEEFVIEVYVDRLTDELSKTVPKQLENVTVRIVETGPFTAR